jgi:hypothetical protein
MNMADGDTSMENHYDFEESGESGWYKDTYNEDGDLISSEQISSDDDEDNENDGF